MNEDIILTNAQIRTNDQRKPWATGIAIFAGKLAAVGTSAEIYKLARPDTRILNAGGRVLSLPEGVSIGSLLRITVQDDGQISLDSIADSPE